MTGQAIAPVLDQAASYAIEHPEQTATVIGAIIAITTNYRKTGKFPIGRLPFHALRDGLREYRDRYFGVDRPKGVPGVIIEADQDDIEAAFRQRHFESGALSSYDYAGEVLNLRRPRGYESDPLTGELVPMETHVRTFETESQDVLAIAHDEANRFEATGEHLDTDALYSWQTGRATVEEVLDDADIIFRSIDSERAAGVTVTSD